MMLFNHDQSLLRSLVFAGFYWFGTIGQVRERANQKIQKNQKNQEFGKIIFDHDQSLLRSLVFTGLGQYGQSGKWQEPDCQGDVKMRMHMMEDRFNMDFHEVYLMSGMEIWGDE